VAVINYIRLGSELIGERPLSGSRTNYARDAVGSVTATLVGDSVQKRYAYKPYGGQLQVIGAGADPAFLWIGSAGYRSGPTRFSDYYVRARPYSTVASRWSTVDPLWYTRQNAPYSYGPPLTWSDPSGRCLKGKNFKIACLGNTSNNIVEEYGCSTCDYETGNCCVYVDGHDFKGACMSSITFLHESEHCANFSNCCEAAAEHVKKAKKAGDKYAVASFELTYELWINHPAVKLWSECNALRVTLSALEFALSGSNGYCGNYFRNDECCPVWQDEYDYWKPLVDRNCGATHPIDCPFGKPKDKMPRDQEVNFYLN
jgi:RHS repeat-associated protein